MVIYLEEKIVKLLCGIVHRRQSSNPLDVLPFIEIPFPIKKAHCNQIKVTVIHWVPMVEIRRRYVEFVNRSNLPIILLKH